MANTEMWNPPGIPTDANGGYDRYGGDGWSYVYYSPEKVGLKPFGEVDFAGDYEFELIVVWEDEAGDLYAATDSGCSCPTPFAEVTGLDDLAPVKDANDLEPLLAYCERYGEKHGSDPDYQALKAKVARHLRERRRHG